jgi:hypothetical protein
VFISGFHLLIVGYLAFFSSLELKSPCSSNRIPDHQITEKKPSHIVKETLDKLKRSAVNNEKERLVQLQEEDERKGDIPHPHGG